MPVEIRELIVKATVRSVAAGHRLRRPQPETSAAVNERAMLRQVMRVLEDKKER